MASSMWQATCSHHGRYAKQGKNVFLSHCLLQEQASNKCNNTCLLKNTSCDTNSFILLMFSMLFLASFCPTFELIPFCLVDHAPRSNRLSHIYIPESSCIVLKHVTPSRLVLTLCMMLTWQWNFFLMHFLDYDPVTKQSRKSVTYSKVSWYLTIPSRWNFGRGTI